MANNKIQIKRSTSNAIVTGLSAGELAFTQASNTLWIGTPDGLSTISIAGQRFPGTLTANASLVANSTSGIDKVIVANAAITSIWANGASGSNGQVLVTNGTAIYWGTGTSGSNTYIQFNDSGVANGVAGFTFDKTSNTLFVGNLVNTTTVNAATHSVGTSFIANSTGVYSTGTVNATVVSVGSAVIANATGIYTTGTINASSINSTSINTSTFSVGSNFTANSTLVYGQALNIVNQVNTATLYATTSANIASAVYANSSGVYSTGVANATTLSVGTAFIANSTKVTFTGANIDATSAFLKVADAVISGNLTINGTVTTINTQQLVVNDNIIELGSNNTTADVVDTGLYSPAGNSTAIWYSGIARIAASSTNTNPVFRIFVSNTNPNTSSTIDTSANTKTGTLQSYLQPYGVGGGLVANSSNVQITANSTLGVNFVANSLTLTTALAGVYGGTGKLTVANNSLLYGNSTNGYNELTFNTTVGYVLQSNGTAIVYDVLDGGSF